MVVMVVVIDAHGVARAIGAMATGVLIDATSSKSGGLLICLNSSAAFDGRKRAVTNLKGATTTTTTTSTAASAENTATGESTEGHLVTSRGECARIAVDGGPSRNVNRKVCRR